MKSSQHKSQVAGGKSVQPPVGTTEHPVGHRDEMGQDPGPSQRTSHEHASLHMAPLPQELLPLHSTRQRPLPQLSSPAQACVPSHRMVQDSAVPQSTPLAHASSPQVTSHSRPVGQRTLLGQEPAMEQSIMQTPLSQEAHTGSQIVASLVLSSNMHASNTGTSSYPIRPQAFATIRTPNDVYARRRLIIFCAPTRSTDSPRRKKTHTSTAITDRRWKVDTAPVETTLHRVGHAARLPLSLEPSLVHERAHAQACSQIVPFSRQLLPLHSMSQRPVL